MKHVPIKTIARQTFPKLFAIAKILFKPAVKGPYYMPPGFSPDCRVMEHSIFPVFKQYVQKYFQKDRLQKSYAFADIGGSKKNDRVKDLAGGMRYYIIDIDPIEKDELTITGDICSCPHVPSDSFDIILNDNLMEHVKQPWEAFGEMGRLLKSGGLCLTRTVFSWNYHPYPEDYWRFTHSALNHLGEKNGGLVTLLSGYAINNRRSNHAGGNLKNNLDGVPIDGYGGWLEGWSVFHIGQKV